MGLMGGASASFGICGNVGFRLTATVFGRTATTGARVVFFGAAALAGDFFFAADGLARALGGMVKVYRRWRMGRRTFAPVAGLS